MANQLHRPHSARSDAASRLPRLTVLGRRALLAASGLAAALPLAGSPAGAVQLDAPADAQAIAVATDDPTLASVLIATRQGDPRPVAGEPELAPISQVSDHNPELAEPLDPATPPRNASKAGEGSSETSGSASKTPRMAALPADGSQALADVATAYRTESRPKAARFHGVVPGESTREQLITAWGEPTRTGVAEGDTLGGEVLSYDLEPFEEVEALIEDGAVGVVRVTLAEDVTVAQLTKRLKLAEITPVRVVEPSTGELLAVTFPEKGLTLLAKPSPVELADFVAARVSHLVLEPIDALAFALRAEQRPNRELSGRLADLDQCLALDADNAHALWLRSQANAYAGRAEAAERDAAQAVELEPSDPTYRITWAATLRRVGEPDRAVLETRRVLDDAATPDLARAMGFHLMGDLAALGDASIAAKAIDFQNAAIELADQLATSDSPRERLIAKDLLVEAHLAVAEQVARRDYADKDQTVADWIGRASGLAESRIDSEQGGLELRLGVASGALAALAEMKPTKDPSPWIEEAEETAQALLEQSDDPLFKACVHWELGTAYQNAVRIEHTRGDAERALGFGTRALDELSAGAEPRTTSVDAERLVGRLYFYLGAVNAVHKQDHAEAVGWYDKGRPILAAERGPSELVTPRREGEALVSMGVSYWKQDQRDLAVELTEAGAELMEQGVSLGVLEESALAVPYGNLATMHKNLGQDAKAAEFARLARGVRPAGKPATDDPAPAANETAATPNRRSGDPSTQSAGRTTTRRITTQRMRPRSEAPSNDAAATPSTQRVSRQRATPPTPTPGTKPGERQARRPSYRRTIGR